MNILLTGASGFIGKRLLKQLVNDGHHVVCLGRSNPLAKKTDQVSFISCDLVDDEQVLALASHDQVKNCQAIIHMAALYDLEAAYADCYMSNVHATGNLLQLAHQLGSLEHFHHISTVAVAGDCQGVIAEAALETTPKFGNAYAHTKMLSEKMVLEQQSGEFKRRVYRLGIVVGDSTRGHVEKVDGPYYFMRFLAQAARLSRGHLLRLPILALPYRKNAQFPIIPVNDVVHALSVMVARPTAEESKVYHLVDATAPNMQQFLDDLLEAFDFHARVFPLPSNKLNAIALKTLGIPKELLDYVYGQATFDNQNMRQDYPALRLHSYQQAKKHLFQGAKKAFFRGVSV